MITEKDKDILIKLRYYINDRNISHNPYILSDIIQRIAKHVDDNIENVDEEMVDDIYELICYSIKLVGILEDKISIDKYIKHHIGERE